MMGHLHNKMNKSYISLIVRLIIIIVLQSQSLFAICIHCEFSSGVSRTNELERPHIIYQGNYPFLSFDSLTYILNIILCEVALRLSKRNGENLRELCIFKRNRFIGLQVVFNCKQKMSTFICFSSLKVFSGGG